MTNSKLKQSTSAELFKALTPRQKCAIANVVHANDLSTPNPRHHRINGSIQSILTFEVNELSALKGHGEDESNRAVDGYFGIWHARASAYPVSDLKDWDRLMTAKAEGILMRLFSGVGIEEHIEVHPGSDGKSVHVHKWATHGELAIAEERLGRKFSEMAS